MNQVYKELSKKELKEITNNIQRMTYIGNETHKENFKQVFVYKKDENNNKVKIYLPFIVSTFGRVFSINYWRKGCINQIKTAISNDGYELVNMRYKKNLYGIDMHRLIGQCFLKKRKEEYTDINHKDGIKTNNYIWNLEWCTHHKNIIHAWKNGLHPIYYGDKSSHHKFTSDMVEKACQLIVKNYKPKEVAELSGVSHDMVKKIINKKNWLEISDKYDFSNYIYKKA